MPQGMCPSIEDHSLDLQWRPFSSSSASRGRTQSSSAPAALSSPLLGRVLRRRRNRPIPREGFSGVEVCPLCGPVGFRGVAPHHSPIQPELFHQRFHMDRFPMGRIYYQLRVLCFGLTTATNVFTRLMAPMSTILHRYVVGMLRYLDDWLILAESRTTGIQARDRLLQVCAELGLQVIAESRP